ncbi:MAG: metallophosphoesterase family protein [Acidimicrobiales bacterium]
MGDTTFTRRGIIGLGAGVALTAVAGGSLRMWLYERMRWGEDFFPGTPPDITLEPQAWTTTGDTITFAVLGDNGTGGRNQMDVARQMAQTYQATPYGLVLLVGDISYYGSIDDRWDEVFVEPYTPLIDAGVEWELAIGNHELSEKKSDSAAAEIEAQLRAFGKPGTYYSEVHGPMEVFVLDTSIPLATGEGGPEQLAWLEEALVASQARWKVAIMHQPPYSSGSHGSHMAVREAVEPLFIEHGVDIAFTGHDHHYERTTPQSGVVWVVSGAGAKRSRVGESDFTAHAESTLQFMLVEIDGDTMVVEAITTDGRVIDEVVLQARAAG